jgi:DNA-binding MarR family transcriptional regulator
MPAMTEPTRVPVPARSSAPGDLPTPTIDPLDRRLDGWRSFLMSHSLVTRRLDDELRAEEGISLAEYDALVQLARAPDGRLRMNQLADRVLLSRSGVTRLVDRLVSDGLVSRTACPSDARGSMAVLTARGRETLRRASRTHLRGVDRYFLAALTDAELGALRVALDAVIDRSAAGTPFEGCTAHGRPEDRPID